MKFFEASNVYSLNKLTYINLRWIAYSGQLIAILFVQFLLDFKFNYLTCLGIVLFSILTNLYLQFKIRENQINNFISTTYLSFDIIQLGLLFFFYWRNNQPIYIPNYSASCIFFSVLKYYK